MGNENLTTTTNNKTGEEITLKHWSGLLLLSDNLPQLTFKKNILKTHLYPLFCILFHYFLMVFLFCFYYRILSYNVFNCSKC